MIRVLLATLVMLFIGRIIDGITYPSMPATGMDVVFQWNSVTKELRVVVGGIHGDLAKAQAYWSKFLLLGGQRRIGFGRVRRQVFESHR